MLEELVHNHSSPATKVALFRALFRGRDDVYPRRFESLKTGKSGYQPACANEWVRGFCDKRSVRCSECPHRRFLTVTDEAVRCHLSGRDQAGKAFVMGVYPMLRDETCFLLAVDFDKKSWLQDDSAAFMESCRRLDLPAALERSRSGTDGHVWLFFEEPIPAVLARKLASHVLTETMERRPDVGLDSYDRLVSNQDTLPKGGFGNLVALPLQKEARERGNSVFVDESFVPYPDQWAFLASVRRIGLRRAEELVEAAESRGRVVGVRLAPDDEEGAAPWNVPPSRRPCDPPLTGLPGALELVLGDQIYIAKDELPPGLRSRLLR
jgi:hypothetical protein